jgi:hypothetical protein
MAFQYFKAKDPRYPQIPDTDPNNPALGIAIRLGMEIANDIFTLETQRQYESCEEGAVRCHTKDVGRADTNAYFKA